MAPSGGTITPTGTLNVSLGAVVTVLGNIVTGFGGGGAGRRKHDDQGAQFHLADGAGRWGRPSSSTGPLTTLLLSNSTLTINLGSSPNPVSALL